MFFVSARKSSLGWSRNLKHAYLHNGKTVLKSFGRNGIGRKELERNIYYVKETSPKFFDVKSSFFYADGRRSGLSRGDPPEHSGSSAAMLHRKVRRTG